MKEPPGAGVLRVGVLRADVLGADILRATVLRTDVGFVIENEYHLRVTPVPPQSPLRTTEASSPSTADPLPSTDTSSSAAEASSHGPALPLLHTQDLFGQTREILIEHCGSFYRLRLTHSNKLILTK